MYCGHARLSVCVCLSVCVSVCLSVYLSAAAACPHYCTDPDVTLVSGRGCPLVVHYWADLQSVHGLRCCGNITRTRNVSEYMLVLALSLVVVALVVCSFVIAGCGGGRAERQTAAEVSERVTGRSLESCPQNARRTF